MPRSLRERSPSRRSITSATVVPTTSEGHSEVTSGDSVDNPDRAAEIEQNPQATEYDLQVASNEQDCVMTAACTLSPVDTLSSQEQPSPPKPISLPISQSIPMNVELTDRGVFRLVNNYKALAKNFKQLQPFARRPDGTYPASTICVMCTAVKPTSVLFPCQHMCVCDSCIEDNEMSPDCSMHLERCVCPVCSADIGLILPHIGNEEELYWKWALASNPSLPSQFTKDFKNASKTIGESSLKKKGSIPPRRSSDTSKPCQDFPKPNLRRSWSATLSKRESAYKLDTPKQREHCMIL